MGRNERGGGTSRISSGELAHPERGVPSAKRKIYQWSRMAANDPKPRMLIVAPSGEVIAEREGARAADPSDAVKNQMAGNIVIWNQLELTPDVFPRDKVQIAHDFGVRELRIVSGQDQHSLGFFKRAGSKISGKFSWPNFHELMEWLDTLFNEGRVQELMEDIKWGRRSKFWDRDIERKIGPSMTDRERNARRREAERIADQGSFEYRREIIHEQ